ncbi:hypothetical protein GCM10027043_45920 [Ferruginibacter profundus]
MPAAMNDTFAFYGEEDSIPLLPGFGVDTIKYYDKSTDYTETLICPYLKEKEYNQVNEVVKKEIKRKAALCYLDTTYNEATDTSKEVFGFTIDNMLLQMYKNRNLVSYGFLSISNEPNQTRPFRKYFSVNYDTIKKQFIYFSDYFKINSSSDSAFLKSLIYGDVGNTDLSLYSLNNAINFSFNDQYVYFYFDMFGETAIPMGLVKQVKRKYIVQLINEAYK